MNFWIIQSLCLLRKSVVPGFFSLVLLFVGQRASEIPDRGPEAKVGFRPNQLAFGENVIYMRSARITFEVRRKARYWELRHNLLCCTQRSTRYATMTDHCVENASKWNKFIWLYFVCKGEVCLKWKHFSDYYVESQGIYLYRIKSYFQWSYLYRERAADQWSRYDDMFWAPGYSECPIASSNRSVFDDNNVGPIDVDNGKY